MTHDGHTISLPPCGQGCDMSEQSERALILGYCAWCGHKLDEEKATRMLNAKRLIRLQAEEAKEQ
jgi:hypothetical protein